MARRITIATNEPSGESVTSHPASEPFPSIARGCKVFIETYGCQMNVSDTELIRGILAGAGHEMAPTAASADLILVNTCAIREHAEKRVWARLGQLAAWKRERPELLIGVVGCMAKHVGEKLTGESAAVDILASPDAYRSLPRLIAAAGDSTQLDLHLDRGEHYENIDPVRASGVHAWITIMRGCDKFCSFCIVPYVRGRERAVPPDEVARQVEEHAGGGGREVTLLGQTVNAYRHGRVGFAELLTRVAAVPGIQRVRFTSPHPSDFTPETLVVMAAHPAIMKHVHVPVQSGADRVLERMGRDYTRRSYLDLVARMRAMMPSITFTTDLIVGFPGETRADYQETLSLVREVEYESAFMFKYSARPGTIAYREIPDTVSEEEKGERLERLIGEVEAIAARRNRAWEGRTVEVLVEGTSRRDRSRLYGKTEHGKTVVFPAGGRRAGEMVEVRVLRSTSHTLHGELATAGNGARQGEVA
jgi:tRNA-2-methylthio-N6-dimethylallyladenosine synthase